MVKKEEGATMECPNGCDTELICRKKDYGGGYEPTLQWQNFDGTAHYFTKDGKNFTCNVPEEEGQQTQITDPPRTAGTAPSTIGAAELALLKSISSKQDTILLELQSVREFVEPLFLKMVDDQIGKKNPDNGGSS